MSAALDGRAPVLRSDGSPERDFLYVEDAAAAYLAVADALDRDDVRGEAFNAGSGRSYRVGDVVGLIAKLAGWEPAVGLEDGLQKPSTGTATTRTQERRPGPASPDPTALGFRARGPGGLIGSRHLGQVRVAE